VPELLNFTPATAGAANAYAAQAATRPLAGFGAGAFTCEGALVGSGVNERTAALALPRIKAAIGAIGAGQSQAAVFSGARMTTHVGIVQEDTKKLIQTTRIYPATPGGLGPYPAREPEPV
jgi:hypothetical protein